MAQYKRGREKKDIEASTGTPKKSKLDSSESFTQPTPEKDDTHTQQNQQNEQNQHTTTDNSSNNNSKKAAKKRYKAKKVQREGQTEGQTTVKPIKLTKEEKEEYNAKTKSLFSELLHEDDEAPFSTTFALEPSQQTEQAAWVDEDDEIMVSTRKQHRIEETKVSGHLYQEKLRQRHKALAVQSDDWAQIKPKKSLASLGGDEEEGSDSDDDNDTLLYRSQPLTMPSSRLAPTTLEILSNPVVQQHQSAVRRVCIHPTEPIAISVDGNTLKVYRLGEKMVVLHSVRMQDMDITDACFSIDGSQVFVCGNQPSLYILEVGSGKLSFLKQILGRKEKGFTRIYASPNEKHCALLGNSGSIILISTLSKQFVGELRGPSNSVYCATFAPDGTLYAAYAGGVVIIWDIVARTAIHSFTNPSLTLATAIAISSDSKYIALGSNVGVVDVFNMKDLAPGGPRLPTPRISLDNLLTSVNTIKFNHDSQLMAIGTDVKKQGLRLVHLPSFSVYQNWPVETTFALLKDVSFSPAGGFLLTGENVGKVKMFRLPHFPAA